DWEAPLQFRNQITGLGHMKRSGGDEQNMISSNHSVARVHRGPFYDRQNVTLHALARDIRSVTAFAAGDLVNLIEKDDAGLLDAIDGDARDLVHVNQALFFFLDQVLEGLADLQLPLLGALAEDVGQHVFEIDVHLFDALVRDDLEGGHRALPYLNFDHAIIELAFA